MKQMDTILFQQSQSIDEIKNRLSCIETGSFPEDGGLSGSGSGLNLEQTKNSLMVDDDFVAGIVDNIMTNSNLSDIIEQIDSVQNENRELRELLHAQQKTINEINVMLLKLISQSLNQVATVVSVVPTTTAPTTSAAATTAATTSEKDTVADADAHDDVDDTDADDDNNIQLDVIEPSSNMQSVD